MWNKIELVAVFFALLSVSLGLIAAVLKSTEFIAFAGVLAFSAAILEYLVVRFDKKSNI